MSKRLKETSRPTHARTRTETTDNTQCCARLQHPCENPEEEPLGKTPRQDPKARPRGRAPRPDPRGKAQGQDPEAKPRGKTPRQNPEAKPRGKAPRQRPRGKAPRNPNLSQATFSDRLKLCSPRRNDLLTAQRVIRHTKPKQNAAHAPKGKHARQGQLIP